MRSEQTSVKTLKHSTSPNPATGVSGAMPQLAPPLLDLQTLPMTQAYHPAHKLPPSPMLEAIWTTESQQPDWITASTEAAQVGEQGVSVPLDIKSMLQSGASSWPMQSASAAEAWRRPAQPWD